MEIFQLRAFSDNYIYLLKGPDDEVAVVDAGEPGPVEELLAARGWRLTHILNTHHHRDHVGANLALKERHGCRILGARRDAPRTDRTGARTRTHWPGWIFWHNATR